MAKRTDPRARFEAKVDRSDPSGCHRWTGAHVPKGYGHFRYEGKMRPAHVVALLLDGVAIPAGMTVDHVWSRGCRFRDCVRRDHLEVVTGRDNTLRGGNPAAINARKGRCVRDHALTPDNTLSNGRRGRRCRTCHREREAARRAGQHYPLPIPSGA